MRNILVSLLVNLGDVIMMTAALDLIRRHHPPERGRLGVLVRPEAAGLLAGHPQLDDLIVYPYRSGSPLAGFGELRRRIKAGGYDFFLSLDRRPRGAAAALLAGIPRRVGPDILYEGSHPRFWTRPLFTRMVHLTPEECRGDQVEMFQWVARRALELEGRGRITLPPETPENAARAEGLLSSARGPVIGLCVKTNDPAKTWPAADYAALMARLKSELNAFLYVTGTAGDREYADQVISAAGDDSSLNLAGQTSFPELAALAARSDLFITPDNGAAHLAANSGLKNMICLLISTTPEKIAGSLAPARFLTLTAAREGEAETDSEQVDLVFQAAAESLRNEHS